MTSRQGEHEIHNPGDVGRRIARRRIEIGLTRAELAERSGMATQYIDYLEHQPVRVSSSALARLALALDTTSAQLLGGGIDQPPGRGRPGPAPQLLELTRAECLGLISPGGVGRLVWTGPEGPMAVPMNYTVVEDRVVVRTSEETEAAQQAVGADVAFEVDHIDDAMREGWSVLVSGTAEPVTDSGELRRIIDSAPPTPWAGELGRTLFIALSTTRVSGRRVLRG